MHFPIRLAKPLAVLHSLAVFALWLSAAPALTGRPNFVFILIDDMGWADIGANGSGYYKTPHIDQLAKEGMLFSNGYASCAVCSPSRAAILTGQNPARLHITDYIPGEGEFSKGRHGLPEWTKALDPGIPNLLSGLRDAGYATAFIGKWHLGGKGHSPVDCGFEMNIGGSHAGQPASYFWPYGKKGDRFKVAGLGESGGREGEYLTDRLTSEALDFLDKNHSRAFFLQLSHYVVHTPLMAKEEDVSAFRSRPPSNGQNNPVYAAMVKSVDDSVGRLLTKLRELGIEDNTVVIFSSDNGGGLRGSTRNFPLRSGKGFPYEGGVRVPLIVRAPGLVKAGSVTGTRVTGADFAPTMLALAGAPPLPLTDGADITPVLRGGELPPRVLGWSYPHYWSGGLISPYAALIADDWKIIRWYEYDSEELYHLTTDPSEKTDLAKSNPDQLAAVRVQLDQWLKDNHAQTAGLKKNASGAPAADTNPAVSKKWY